LRLRRHGDQFAANAADADTAGRMQERNLRDVQGGAGADHGEDVGVVLRSKEKTLHITCTSLK